jgi:pyruvate formate lyase activating enzyme
LNCVWCHNPESKHSATELWFDAEHCIDDGICVEVCPGNAISEASPRSIDPTLCKKCFLCVDSCPTKALRCVGEHWDIDDIVKSILPYQTFFDISDGGVTLSGGEPLLHVAYLSELLKSLKNNGIHTLIETSGFFDMARFKALILPFTDAVYFDIKLMDETLHKNYCGVGNQDILANFTELKKSAEAGELDLLPRTPLIQEITDTDRNICQIIEFYNSLGVKKTSLIPNHPFWFGKFDNLCRQAPVEMGNSIKELYDENKLSRIKAFFTKNGIEVV